MSHPPFQLALVTGASSGIGQALCRFLAQKKINLLMTGRNQEKLTTLANELRKFVKVEFFAADLEGNRNLIIEKIEQHSPDLVINNAGLGLYGPILAHDSKKQIEILKINGEAVLELSIVAARAMLDAGKRGVILNVSSAAAFQVFPYFAVYAASKAFVNSFSQAFDEEVKSQGVRVLAACPGMVDTPFRKRASEGKEIEPPPFSMTTETAVKEIWYQIEKKQPLRIFDWRYRLATFLSHFLPKRFLAKRLRKNIERRLSS